MVCELAVFLPVSLKFLTCGLEVFGELGEEQKTSLKQSKIPPKTKEIRAFWAYREVLCEYIPENKQNVGGKS